jgi:hypothetical protein
MSKLQRAVLQAGVVKPEEAREIQRWGLPVEPDDPEEPSPTTAEEAVAMIREALESREQVEVRRTDLDIMKRYIEKHEEARLYVTEESTNARTNFKVSFCITSMGEYAMPWTWHGDTIEGLLTNGLSYLRTGDKKIYFSDVRELFFGKHKAFIICTPSTEEEGEDD